MIWIILEIRRSTCANEQIFIIKLRIFLLNFDGNVQNLSFYSEFMRIKYFVLKLKYYPEINYSSLVFALWFVSVQIDIVLKWHPVYLCWLIFDISRKQTMWIDFIVNNGQTCNIYRPQTKFGAR